MEHFWAPLFDNSWNPCTALVTGQLLDTASLSLPNLRCFDSAICSQVTPIDAMPTPLFAVPYALLSGQAANKQAESCNNHAVCEAFQGARQEVWVWVLNTRSSVPACPSAERKARIRSERPESRATSEALISN